MWLLTGPCSLASVLALGILPSCESKPGPASEVTKVQQDGPPCKGQGRPAPQAHRSVAVPWRRQHGGLVLKRNNADGNCWSLFLLFSVLRLQLHFGHFGVLMTCRPPHPTACAPDSRERGSDAEGRGRGGQLQSGGGPAAGAHLELRGGASGVPHLGLPPAVLRCPPGSHGGVDRLQPVGVEIPGTCTGRGGYPGWGWQPISGHSDLCNSREACLPGPARPPQPRQQLILIPTASSEVLTSSVDGKTQNGSEQSGRCRHRTRAWFRARRTARSPGSLRTPSTWLHPEGAAKWLAMPREVCFRR